MFTRFIRWIFSFFPSAKNPIMPVVELTPKQINQIAPKLSEGIHLAGNSEWNPMLKYPRNETCFCGSGTKAKKCCLIHQPLAVTKEYAEKAKPLVKIIRTEARV